MDGRTMAMVLSALLVSTLPVSASDDSGPAPCPATLAGRSLTTHSHQFSSGAGAYFIECHFAASQMDTLQIEVYYHPEPGQDSLYCSLAGQLKNDGNQIYSKYHESLKIYGVWSGRTQALSGPDEAALRAATLEMMRDLESVAAPSCTGNTVPLVFNGFAVVTDAQGTWLELSGALVRVLLEWDGQKRVLEATTGLDGQYLAETSLVGSLPRGLTYRVQLELRDEVVEVRSVAHFGDRVVTATTTQRDFARNAVRGDTVFTNFILGTGATELDAVWFREDGSLASLPGVDGDIVRDAAVAFHHGMRAARYGRDVLGVHYDFELPVKWRLHHVDPVEGTAHYDQQTATINIDAAYSRSDNPVVPFVHLHEFGHHLHADSNLTRNDVIPVPHEGKAHDGYFNDDSVHSFIEGFATFYSGLVQDSPVLGLAGAVINLEHNSFQTPGFERLEEELQVAALFWDLVDDTAEPGDDVQVPLRDLWRHLLAAPLGIVDVHSLHQALVGKVGSAVDPATGLSALDRAFVAHGFYWDRDGNGAWDSGEPAGYADSHRHRFPSDVRAPRPVPPPPLEGTLLVLDVGQGPDPTSVTVRLVHTEPYYDFEYVAHGTELPLFLPEGVLRAEITPLASGFRPEAPVIVQQLDYAEEVTRAQQQGRPAFMETVVDWTAVDLAAPSRFRAEDTAAGIRLSWRAPAGSEVVVVAGLGAAPGDPTLGRQVYRGTDTSVTDTHPVPGTHYAAFALRDGQVSRAAVAEPGDGGGKGAPAAPWAFVALFLLALAVRRR